MVNGNTPPKTFFIPQLSDHAHAMAGVIRGMGIDARVLPKSDDESLAIGLSLCRGRECLPCFLCTGDMIRKCRELGPDVDQVAFIMPRGPGPCRFGQYNVLQKQILTEQGYPEARIVSPTSKDSYALFGSDPLTLRKRAWQAVVAVDLLTRVVLVHRPYEVNKGSADALYQACLDRIVAASEAGAGERLIEAMTWAADGFAALPVDRTEERPLISVIGELYLLLNTRANLEIVRAVEAAGGEVLQGTFMDYLHFVDWKRKKLAVLFGDYADYIKGALSDRYQVRWARRLEEPLRPVLRHGTEAPVRDVLADLKPTYEPILGTEAVLTMGRALDLYRHGVSGFINVLPFSCMPGTIVVAMAPTLREKMDGVPWLDIAYDGQEETNIHTRLEAFMHQAEQFRRRVVAPRRCSGAGDQDAPFDGPAAPFSRRRVVRGVALFSALSVAGLAALFAVTGNGQVFDTVWQLGLGFMGLAVAASVVDLLVGAYRYLIFLQRIKPDTTFGLTVRAQLANRFGAALTPSQTGGGPAFLYVFYRGGIPVSQGLSVLMVNFLTTLLFFLPSGAVAAFMLRDHFSHAAAGYLIQYSFAAFGVMTVLLVVALWRPDLFIRCFKALAARLRRREARWRAGTARVLESLVEGIDLYRDTCRFFMRRTPLLVLASLVLTFIMYGTKFTMAYFVMRGLGVQADYGVTLAVLVLLHFVLYLAPSPGGSGIAELSTGALMAILMPAYLLGLFTLAYRFFLVYAPAAIGAFVLAALLRVPRDRTSAAAIHPLPASG